jgi:hypothetical protein
VGIHPMAHRASNPYKSVGYNQMRDDQESLSSSAQNKPGNHNIMMGLDDGQGSDYGPGGAFGYDKGNKRFRRTANEIVRKYTCWCSKAYGSEGSLNQHKKLKNHNHPPEGWHPPRNHHHHQ